MELNAEIKETLFVFALSEGTRFLGEHEYRSVHARGGATETGKSTASPFTWVSYCRWTRNFSGFASLPGFTSTIYGRSFTLLPMSSGDLTWNGVEVLLNLSNPVSPEEVAQLFDVKGARRCRVRAAVAEQLVSCHDRQPATFQQA